MCNMCLTLPKCFLKLSNILKKKNEVKKDIHAFKPPLVSDSKIRQIIIF